METEVKKRVITPEQIETFMNGRDPMKRIVNLGYKSNDDFITVFYRDESDHKHTKKEPYYPFLWATRFACQQLCGGNRSELKRLMFEFNIGCKKLSNVSIDGIVREEFDSGYMFMFFAKRAMSQSKFLRFFKLCGTPVYADRDKNGGLNIQVKSRDEDRRFLVVPPQEQYMISTGRRFFKGYDDYDQVYRMTFDLETEGLDPHTKRIVQIGVRTNRGFNKIISITGNTKEELDKSEIKGIKTMLKMIQYFDPDIITAHNGENFDWYFIIVRCEMLGHPMSEISPEFFNGEIIKKEEKESVLKLGGEVESYHQTIVPGRIITDSLHAVRRAQAIDSNMQRADLKYATKYAKMVKPNRVYTPGDMISDIWKDTECHYAFNDTDGDWYLYDPDCDFHLKTLEEFEEEVAAYPSYEEWSTEYIATLSGKTVSTGTYDEECPDDDDDFEDDEEVIDEEEILKEEYNKRFGKSAEQLHAEYMKSLKGKDGDKPMKFHRRNIILDGYELVTGTYIIERYLYDDLWECDKVELKYNTTNFLICKILPVPFKKCTTMGTAGQWKALLMAWSYENNLAIPMGIDTGAFTGGLSRLLRTGYVKKQVKLDYNSLYPSIILTWGISDTNDLMDTMLKFLEFVLTEREKYKGLKKKAGNIVDEYDPKFLNGTITPEETVIYEKAKADYALNDKKQAQMKVLGNSFFGSFGSNNGSVFPWKSQRCAEQTTCTGRQSLRLMISHFTRLGYIPCVGDSVTGDTPLFIKWKNNEDIDIKPISEIFDHDYSNKDILGREYDSSEKPYLVLCRSGWHEVSYVYRHETNKPIYRITNKNGEYVDVTKDHSLFDKNRDEIKPTEIKENTLLETFNGHIDSKAHDKYLNDMSYDNIIDQMILGKIDRIPREVLNNMDRKHQGIFYSKFMEKVPVNAKFSKTMLAGLKFLLRK